MKVLNLYAGVGGNRKLWEGVEVTAVENNEDIAGVYKELYPNDNVIIGNAHEYLINHYKEFDFVWSSPPCQRHSKFNKATRHNSIRYIDGTLFEEIIFLKTYFKGPWIVENVVPYYDILLNPVRIGRHLFWSNFPINQFELKSPANFHKIGKNEMMNWLGIHFEKTIYYGKNHCPAQILRNCVHPKLGEHIFNNARGKQINTTNQMELFNYDN